MYFLCIYILCFFFLSVFLNYLPLAYMPYLFPLFFFYFSACIESVCVSGLRILMRQAFFQFTSTVFLCFIKMTVIGPWTRETPRSSIVHFSIFKRKGNYRLGFWGAFIPVSGKKEQITKKYTCPEYWDQLQKGTLPKW